MSLHPLTNFEIPKYCQNKPNFNLFFQEIIYLKKGLDLCNVINDGYKSIGTNWIALYVNAEIVTYLDSFGVEHILKEIKKFIRKKYHNKYLQNTSIKFYNVRIFLYWIYCFYIKNKILFDYTNLSPPNKNQKND